MDTDTIRMEIFEDRTVGHGDGTEENQMEVKK